jgi:hypothetical protein
MKHNIFDQPAREEVFSRVQKLTVESKGKWGRLSAPQMIRHLAEACRLAFDEIPIADQSTFFTRTIVKKIFLSNIKPPGREKGKIKTLAEIDIVELKTTLAEMQIEKENYKALVERMVNTPELSKKHPLFGKMSRTDWGLLTYAHADYHLTQFSL